MVVFVTFIVHLRFKSMKQKNRQEHEKEFTYSFHLCSRRL